MTPTGWFELFLNKRGLYTPDGRALYKYRLKESEYSLLKVILTENPDHFEEWDACFVVYASEWWRRNYSEGHWTWDPIFRSIRKNPAINNRNHIVTGGFEIWGRKVYKDSNGHNDYLATVIVECGIPTQILNNEKGWLKRIICCAYADLSVTTLSELDTSHIVDQLAEQINIPKSLRKNSFYELIAQIVHEAISLKREFGLGKEQSPTGFLDQVKPEWRKSFPVQIDVEAGKKFLDELLTEVAMIPDPKNYDISLIKELVKNGDQWRIKTSLRLPNDFYKEEDLRIEEGSIGKFPPKLSIELINSVDEIRQVGIAYKTQKAGKLGLQLTRHQAAFGVDAHFKSWRLYLNQPEQSLSVELPLPGGEALDQESPWVFIEKDGRWELKAMASHKTHSSAAIVVANKEWKASGDVANLGKFDVQRDIYIVEGKSLFIYEGQRFQINTGSNIEDRYSYILQGNKSDYSVKNNVEVYLGMPALFKVNNDSLRKSKIYKSIQVKRIGQINWQQLSNELVGTMHIRILGDEGEVLFNKKISVLPKDFSISFESVNPIKGNVILKQSSHFKVSLLCEGLRGNIERQGDGHVLELESLEAVPPKNVSLSMIDPFNSKTILNVPFPASGVRFFNGSGSPLNPKFPIYLDNLFGYRIFLFNPSANRRAFNIVFELVAENVSNVRIVKTLPVETYHKEVSLIDFQGVIRKLFAVTESLDAEVSISIDNGSSIKVRRYSSIANACSEERLVTIAGGQDYLLRTGIFAFRFDEELGKQTIKALTPIIDDEVHKGEWKFRDLESKPGKWLIFPTAESAINFRPRLWVLSDTISCPDEDQIEELEHIKDAARILDGLVRISKLTDLSIKMAKDLTNPNWNEIAWLWKNTSHLPLNTFDVWTAFTRSEEALVALLFQQDNGLVVRISDEYPVLFETIPVQKWINAAQRFYEYLQKNMPEYAQDIVESKLQFLDDHFNLNCLAKIIRSEILEKEIIDLKIVADEQFVKWQINFRINGGEGQAGLKHRKADHKWPEFLIEKISSKFLKLPVKVRDLFPSNPVKDRRSVIYLPALLAASTINPEIFRVTGDDSKVFQIREIQDFDREWFNAIYDMVQGYCWMNKINTHEHAE